MFSLNARILQSPAAACGLKLMLWWDVTDHTSNVPAPWRLEPQAFFDALNKQIPFGSMALGILDPNNPGSDEILNNQGWLRKSIEHWCQRGHVHDPLLAQARERGVAVANRMELHGEIGLPVREHLMMVMIPEQLPDRWWWLLLGRDDKAFTPMEQNLATLILRQLQTAFNQGSEPGMGRIVLGHDDRLIHADPAAQVWLLQSPEVFDELVAHLHGLVEQRWPGLEPNVGHDFAVELGGKPYWVCFYQTSTTDQLESRRWYLETRELESDELPLIGALDDERTAQAVGFMHDNFQKSPSLAEIAQAVHVSPFHFHRLFSKHVGVSPKQYLQRKQLQAAKWLLRTTRLPIAAVAVRSGFSSHGHFTSTFHRVIGEIPSHYRDNH